MKIEQGYKARLTEVSMWCIQDPRRVMVIVATITMLATALALAAGLTHPGILVAPTGGGGSGGTG